MKTELHHLIDAFSPIEGWLTKKEGLFLYFAAQETGTSGDVVEIGSWKGKSTVCIAKGLQKCGKGKVYAIDPHKGNVAKQESRDGRETFSAFTRTIGKVSVADVVVPVVATSRHASRHWHKSIRFLFIDGLHDYGSASEDFRLWQNHVSPGGMIAFHDGFCGIKGVMAAVEESILHSDHFRSIGVVGSILYGITGEPTWWEYVMKQFRVAIINIAHFIYRRTNMPDTLRFFFLHRFLRLFLFNQFDFLIYRHTRTI